MLTRRFYNRGVDYEEEAKGLSTQEPFQLHRLVCMTEQRGFSF